MSFFEVFGKIKESTRRPVRCRRRIYAEHRQNRRLWHGAFAAKAIEIYYKYVP